MCLSQYCTVASLSSCSWYLVPWAAESRGIEVCQRMAFPKNASSTRSFENASYIASSPSSKQTKTTRNVAGDDNKYVFYGYIYNMIWYKWYIWEKCNDNCIVNPGISCCRVKGDIGFLEMPWNIWNILPMACAGPMIQARPFRGYAWRCTHLGRFGGRHCDKTFGHVHFDHSDLGQLGVLLVVLSVAIKTLAWRSVGWYISKI